MVGTGGQVEQIARDHLNSDPLVERIRGGADVEVAGASQNEADLGVGVQVLEEELAHLRARQRKCLKHYHEATEPMLRIQ